MKLFDLTTDSVPGIAFMKLLDRVQRFKAG
jgi:hypothetical protein